MVLPLPTITTSSRDGGQVIQVRTERWQPERATCPGETGLYAFGQNKSLLPSLTLCYGASLLGQLLRLFLLPPNTTLNVAWKMGLPAAVC